jgi:pimeloyl-ACP methyl ester carboxylesterase
MVSKVGEGLHLKIYFATSLSNKSRSQIMKNIDCILFAQHGWADNTNRITQLAQRLADANTLVISPNLGWLNTWIAIEPLITRVETEVTKAIATHPHAKIKIIGHSMGGLIWLELLDRHPEWWTKIHSLILLGSPIGGAHLARMFDPFSIGIGIARDLGKSRRAIAEKIAQNIPTLVIAADFDRGSDRTITVESTKFLHSQFICLNNLSHNALKIHPQLDEIIYSFWENPILTSSLTTDYVINLIDRLRNIPGMTDICLKNFDRSQIYLSLKNGLSIRMWTNYLQMKYIFLVDRDDKCLYSGYVGWLHGRELFQILEEIKKKYADSIDSNSQRII